MKTRAQSFSEDSAEARWWSLRILVLGIIGILFLTMYPFRLVFVQTARSPFLLDHSGKFGVFDSFLNVLLFVPYGFGLAGEISHSSRSRLQILAATLLAGTLLSYAIEFLQLFIPGRDSGWNDVATNSTGAFVGALIFQFWGPMLLRLLRNTERAIGAFATARNAGIALLLYFAVWFFASARLQRESSLGDWKTDTILSVGNSRSAQHLQVWTGEVYALEFWSHALPAGVAQRLTASGSPAAGDTPPLSAYNFAGSPPFLDRDGLLPALEWVSKAPVVADPPGAAWNGASWAVTRSPVSPLIADIQKTGRFSVRLRCKPARTEDVWAHIVSIAQSGGMANLEIRQETTGVGFWFRNGLSARPSQLTWRVPNIFVPHATSDLLFSYDGANLSLAANGRRFDKSYYLGPGAALAESIRGVKAVELEGYRYIFYALVFFPAGSFLAVEWKSRPERISRQLPNAFACLVAAILLEFLLTRIGGQPISFGNIGLSFTALCLGAVWINLGGSRTQPRQTALQSSLA